MKLETIDITKINPAPYNPRKDLKPGDIEYEKLKKSITEFDIVEPLIMNKRGNVLIGGHQRLKVLKEMGRTEVEVSVVDLPLSKEKALNLALNKISGEWDLPLLKDLLQEIDTGEFDIEITGFDSKEIEDLINQLHQPEPGLTDEDEVPEPQESVCKPGDLWVLGNHRLLCGNSTSKADVAVLLNGGGCFNVIADPPYNINFKYNSSNDKKTDAEYADFCIQWLELWQAKSVIITPGPRNQKYYPEPRDIGIWIKKNATAGASVFHLRTAEPILFYGEFKKKRNTDVFDYSSGFPQELTAARCAAGVGKTHPPMKSVAFWNELISMFDKEMVADPFAGNGTTLITCEKLGRRCYTMEIDPQYCDVIITRWQNFTGKQAELQKLP